MVFIDSRPVWNIEVKEGFKTHHVYGGANSTNEC